MFKKGDYLVYGTSGVCFVDDITNSPFGVTEERMYYVLKPVASKSNSSVFSPVDNFSVNMRALITEDDIHTLRDSIDSIDIIVVEFEKKRRDIYRSVLSTNLPGDWLKIIRTVAERRRTFRLAHKRLPEVDGEFESYAKAFLFNEIAIVLGTSYYDVEEIVMRRMRECYPGMIEVTDLD